MCVRAGVCVCVSVCLCGCGWVGGRMDTCDCRRATLARSLGWVRAASVPRTSVRAAAHFAAVFFVDSAKNARCFARVSLPLCSEGIAFLDMGACIRSRVSHANCRQSRVQFQIFQTSE